MTTKRVGQIGGGILAGALLLGTASMALAQDPTPSPGTNRTGSGDMMSGQGMSGQGMTGSMDAAHLKVMSAMHATMSATGNHNPALLKTMHGGTPSGR